MDPLIKRILADPQAPGIPSSGLRLAAMLGFTMYVGAVLYSKHVAPLAIQDRIKKEMFPPSSSSSSSAHHWDYWRVQSYRSALADLIPIFSCRWRMLGFRAAFISQQGGFGAGLSPELAQS
jgi:hypothetical protein